MDDNSSPDPLQVNLDGGFASGQKANFRPRWLQEGFGECKMVSKMVQDRLQWFKMASDKLER